ncbi:hypothetical protein ACN28S_39080 [Cystobacter fuscus]
MRFPGGDVSVAPQGTKIFFSVYISSSVPAPRDSQLWVTDGTASGTTLLRRPLSLADEYSSPIYAVSDELVFFSAYEEEPVGLEPWVTDGTPGGTRRLKDIAPADIGGSYPRDFFRVGGASSSVPSTRPGPASCGPRSCATRAWPRCANRKGKGAHSRNGPGPLPSSVPSPLGA